MGLWTELALTVASAKQSGRARDGDRAMAELAPFIVQTARRIHATHASLRRQRAADFVAAAPAGIWNKIERFVEWHERELTAELRANSPKDWFAAWCYVELRFRYLDQGREQGLEPRVRSLSSGAPVAGRIAAGDVLRGEEGPVASFELAPGDVSRIRALDPLDGVILFCLTGQWDKPPGWLWSEWMDRLGLAPPFPPPAFIQAPKPRKRTALADALGVSRDVIYQRWLRLRNKLGKAAAARTGDAANLLTPARPDAHELLRR